MLAPISNSGLSNSNKVPFCGFVNLGQVVRLKNGAEELVDCFVLNTDNIAHLEPDVMKECTKMPMVYWGAKIKTMLGDTIVVPGLKKGEPNWSFSGICRSIEQAIKEGFSEGHVLY